MSENGKSLDIYLVYNGELYDKWSRGGFPWELTLAKCRKGWERGGGGDLGGGGFF